MSVTVAELKADLSAILRRAEAGEEVVVTRHGKPVARIVAAVRKPVLGAMRGKIWMADDFDAPLDVFEEYMTPAEDKAPE